MIWVNSPEIQSVVFIFSEFSKKRFSCLTTLLLPQSRELANVYVSRTAVVRMTFAKCPSHTLSNQYSLLYNRNGTLQCYMYLHLPNCRWTICHCDRGQLINLFTILQPRSLGDRSLALGMRHHLQTHSRLFRPNRTPPCKPSWSKAAPGIWMVHNSGSGKATESMPEKGGGKRRA